MIMCGTYNGDIFVLANAVPADIKNISAKARRGVIVSTQDGGISIGGTAAGETVSVYNAAGSLVKSTKAQGYNTVIGGLAGGNVYVVRIGGTSVKVAM